MSEIHGHKLMLALDKKVYDKLMLEAERRGVSLQEVLRAVVIPEWFSEKRSRMGKEDIFPRIEKVLPNEFR